MIRHLVHLKFREDVTRSQKEALYAKLAALSEHIDGMMDFHHHRNVSVEDPLVRGFRDMFWCDFSDASVRDEYLVHPEHQKVGAEIVDHLDGGTDGVFVCDIEV